MALEAPPVRSTDSNNTADAVKAAAAARFSNGIKPLAPVDPAVAAQIKEKPKPNGTPAVKVAPIVEGTKADPAPQQTQQTQQPAPQTPPAKPAEQPDPAKAKLNEIAAKQVAKQTDQQRIAKALPRILPMAVYEPVMHLAELRIRFHFRARPSLLPHRETQVAPLPVISDLFEWKRPPV